MRHNVRIVGIVLAGSAAVAAGAGRAGPADRAGQILAQAGVRGGLVVHVGCGQGALTAALRKHDALLVHGLDTDPAAVAAARRAFRAAGLAGKVSAAVFDGEHLPYIDGTVNLLLCSRRGRLTEREILRVLRPGGVALLPDGEGLRRLPRPRPAGLDEWTHYLHAPDNNAVSRDRTLAAPLRHLQWTGGPRYGRHHDKTSSVPAVVSAAGRLYYVVDAGPRASILWEAKWQLVARDACNGVVLWRRDIPEWTSRLWPLKSGPATTPRRLVAVGESVYFTPGLRAPVTKFHGADGTVRKVYAGTERTEEVLLAEGTLYLVVNPAIDPNQRGGSWKRAPKSLLAVREADGRIAWRREFPWIAPCTAAVADGRVYFCDGERIVALEAATGRDLWRSEPLPQRKRMPTYFAPTLVAAGGGVLYAGGENWHEHAGSRGLMTFLDGRTGRIVWQRPHLPSGYQSPQDIFVIGGKAWCGSTNSKPGEFDRRYPDVAPSTGEFVGYDLATGRPAGRIPRGADCYWFHHRCHRAKATERYFLTSRTGIEMIDLRSGRWHLHHWVRGACLYGIMPANGLLYAPSHPCACYPEAKLTGFNALSGPRAEPAPAALIRAPRLEKGAAYSAGGIPDPPGRAGEDWPTFRGNMARDGSTPRAVPTDLKVRWQAEVGGRLTQPVVAGGRVYVACADEQAVVALDRADGSAAWTFLAGGRVDSPPTVWRGRVLFGCADGFVYCLRASDGALAWRFRAAPLDRRLVARGQVESVWPVHGSVLVRDGVAWVVAGRSMFLDGGLTLHRLDALTGRVLSTTRLDANDPLTGRDLHADVRVLSMPVASPDVLSCDADFVYMRSQPFRPDGTRPRVGPVPLERQRGEGMHLFAPNGILDDQWWHRAFWVYGRGVLGGPGYAATGNSAPAGKIMVLDARRVYVFGRRREYWRWTTPMEFRLFAVERDLPRPAPPAARPGGPVRRGRGRGQFAEAWSVELPVLVRAMVKAGPTLFAAGPADIVDEKQAAALLAHSEKVPEVLRRQQRLFEGAEGSILLAVAAEDGRKLAEMSLPFAPVFDGLAAAGGALYMSTLDGRVVCLASPAGKP